MVSRQVRWTRFAPIAWGLAISAGAFWIRTGDAERRLPWSTALIASEPVHVVAHCVLYGALALLVWRFVSRRWLVILGVVLALALVQELAQVIGERDFGTRELFDLAVDTLATLLAIAGAQRWARRRNAASAP